MSQFNDTTSASITGASATDPAQLPSPIQIAQRVQWKARRPWASAKHGAADGAKAGQACVVCIRHVSPSDPNGLPTGQSRVARQTVRVWERYTRL
ncbi:MAG TPA: hypothetical protein VF909_13935, partial [Roseiflexaceae bacterium]